MGGKEPAPHRLFWRMRLSRDGKRARRVFNHQIPPPLARRRALAIDKDLNAAIAVTRFGLGARPGEIAAARADPQGYLLAQIRPQGADQPPGPTASAVARIRELLAYRQDREADKRSGAPASAPSKMAGLVLRDDLDGDFLARLQLGAETPAGFRERWALFWANHFTVSANKRPTLGLVGPFEEEAIRPHVFGRFEDLLVASSSHPGMLLYLDQAGSIGPDSPAAQIVGGPDNRKRGLNENLAREIMELHTVGVEAGYTQADVTEFARAMTGWSIVREPDPVDRGGGFLFRERTHEPGARTIMGRRYGEDGQGQALAVMKDLAASPHTAHHLAVKIARHFVADDPPPQLVARLERSYLETGGQLGEVARTLVASPDAWGADALKFKTPYEFILSSWRAADFVPSDATTAISTMAAMGQKAFGAPSPKGWPEEAQVWCAPDAVVKRMAWSEAFAAQVAGERDPAQLADNALGSRLTPLVAKTIARAETRPEGLSILLMSPEFQRR
jgi:uncharacterized protein (DUF1800 family)